MEVIYEDDRTDPAAAVDSKRKLIERDGVLALVGPITSRNLNAIAPEAERLKTPLLCHQLRRRQMQCLRCEARPTFRKAMADHMAPSR